MREIIMPMEDKDYELLMEATKQTDPTDDGWEEIVRCKDCQKWGVNVGLGGRYCNRVLHYTTDDFFCGYGKRKK